jgi:hypothetical protein
MRLISLGPGEMIGTIVVGVIYPIKVFNFGAAFYYF